MKKIFNMTIIVCVLLFASGCNTLDESYADKEIRFIEKKDYGQPVSLKATELTKISDSLIAPSELEIVNNKLLLLDHKSDRPIHVIDIAQEAYLGGFGKKGQGPGEVLVPWELSSNGLDSFIVYDVASKKILGYDLISFLAEKDPYLETRINEKGICSGIGLIENEIYFTNDLVSTNRLFKSKLNDGNIKGLGSLLKNYNQAAEHNYGQSCRAFINHHNNRIVLAYLYAPYFELFDVNDGSFQSILTMAKFYPKFDEVAVGDYKKFATTDETRIGFLDISMTDKYIYLLYSGNKMRRYKMDEGNKILVFDYLGNPVAHYELDKAISLFRVHDDHTIFAIREDLKPEFLKFNIDENKSI